MPVLPWMLRLDTFVILLFIIHVWTFLAEADVIASVPEEDTSIARPVIGCATLKGVPAKTVTESDPGLPRNMDKEYRVHLEEDEGDFDIFCCPDVGNIEYPDVGDTHSVSQPTDLLYAGSSITVTESVTSILAFAQSEDISGAGLGKLLNLINIHLPQPNKCLKTTHSFYKRLESADTKFKLDYYCSVCWKLRASSHDLCDTCVDPNRKVDYFVSLPLGPQIAKLFSRPGFVDKLQYKQNRTKKNESHFEDIYDGELYKEAGIFLCNGYNISLMWYTDGISLYEADNVLDDVVDQRRPKIYRRPYQLPLSVAFEMKNSSKVPSGYTKSGEEPKMTSRCILKCDTHTDLMTCPGGKFDGVTEEKIKAINNAIAEGKKWFLVANYWTNKDRVSVDIIPASKREQMKYPIFDTK
ncbi:hypothetical protein FOCC_FOCC011892 [Frankliniella occidentalis]|nr:hypothetical protein FOCC_FOCC011892 [Frankliniella occidentalis]